MGGSDWVAGRPSRTAATWARSRRWTAALVNWVVPIITAPIWSVATWVCASNWFRAAAMPAVMSAELFILTHSTGRLPSISTASVFVPPTSIPTRSILLSPPQKDPQNPYWLSADHHWLSADRHWLSADRHWLSADRRSLANSSAPLSSDRRQPAGDSPARVLAPDA